MPWTTKMQQFIIQHTILIEKHSVWVYERSRSAATRSPDCTHTRSISYRIECARTASTTVIVSQLEIGLFGYRSGCASSFNRFRLRYVSVCVVCLVSSPFAVCVVSVSVVVYLVRSFGICDSQVRTFLLLHLLCLYYSVVACALSSLHCCAACVCMWLCVCMRCSV